MTTQFSNKHVYIYVICLIVLLSSSCRTRSYHVATHQAVMMSITNDIEEDTVFVQYIAPFKQQLEAAMNTPIGKTAYALPKSPREQSLGGNFFAEALLALGQKIDPEVICAVGTKDGIRIDLPQGNITVGHVFELMPFENYLTILTLKGSDLLILGKFIAASNGQPIAGISVVIKDSKLISMHIQGEPVDPTKTYKLATYDYLANGGDHIKGLSTPVKRVTTDLRIREGLISYIETLTKNSQLIHSLLDERIKILQ